MKKRSDRALHMVMQWGQFLDHDITLTPEPERRCCKTELRRDPLCANIFFGKDKIKGDAIAAFKPTKNQTCIPFSRSDVACATGECE